MKKSLTLGLFLIIVISIIFLKRMSVLADETGTIKSKPTQTEVE